MVAAGAAANAWLGVPLRYAVRMRSQNQLLRLLENPLSRSTPERAIAILSKVFPEVIREGASKR